MQMLKFVRIFLTTILMMINLSGEPLAAEGREDCSIAFAGQLNSRLLNTIILLSEKNCEQRSIIISSNGGEASVSIKIAEIIRDNNIALVIKDYCISSCVEFLIPAAKRISFRDFPVVAVHGNPMLIEFMARHYNPPGIENCEFASSRKEYEIKSRKSNPDFWKAQLKILGVEKFYVGDADSFSGCPQFYVDFKSDLWILSSMELNEHLIIDTDGEICGDKPIICEKKMREDLGMSGRFKFGTYGNLRDNDG